jgi:hypothetical protein
MSKISRLLEKYDFNSFPIKAELGQLNTQYSNVLEDANYHTMFYNIEKELRKIDKVKYVDYYEAAEYARSYINFKVGSLDTFDYQLYVRNGFLYLGNDINNKIYLKSPAKENAVKYVIEYVNNELY